MTHPEAPLDDGRCVCGYPIADCKPYGPTCLYGAGTDFTSWKPAPDTGSMTIISTRTYPSGAVESVIEIAGHRAGLLQLPYHEGDIYALLMGDPPPKPEGESQ